MRRRRAYVQSQQGSGSISTDAVRAVAGATASRLAPQLQRNRLAAVPRDDLSERGHNCELVQGLAAGTLSWLTPLCWVKVTPLRQWPDGALSRL